MMLTQQNFKCKIDRYNQKPVYKCDINGDLICEYDSTVDAAKKTNISQTTISKLCRQNAIYDNCLWTYNQPNDKQNLNIKDILEDYSPDNSIFTEENPEINKLKNIIYNDLDEVDRRIIIMYAELGSLRKLGKELGVCAATALTKIIEIRKKIYDNYFKSNTNTNNNSIYS